MVNMSMDVDIDIDTDMHSDSDFDSDRLQRTVVIVPDKRLWEIATNKRDKRELSTHLVCLHTKSSMIL